ncbi:MAG: hypothetical protein P8Y54_00715 [Xanthomonadales bacterium]
MKTDRLRLFAAGLALALTACQPQQAGSTLEPTELKRQMQQKTERLLWIHLRLDTAANEIAQAEAAARDGNTSAAQFHAQEAYRSLETADEAVLELGQQLQQMVNLDIAD